MPVLMPNCLAARLAAMTMPSPRRPPPTQTGRPCNLGFKAISQLAKKLSPSTCRMRMGVFVFTGKSYLNPNSGRVKSSHEGVDKSCPTAPTGADFYGYHSGGVAPG